MSPVHLACTVFMYYLVSYVACLTNPNYCSQVSSIQQQELLLEYQIKKLAFLVVIVLELLIVYQTWKYLLMKWTKYSSVVLMTKKAMVSKTYGNLDTIAFKLTVVKFSPVPYSVRCMN